MRCFWRRILTEGILEVNAQVVHPFLLLFSCCRENKSYTGLRIFPRFFEQTSRSRREWWLS